MPKKAVLVHTSHGYFKGAGKIRPTPQNLFAKPKMNIAPKNQTNKQGSCLRECDTRIGADPVTKQQKLAKHKLYRLTVSQGVVV